MSAQAQGVVLLLLGGAVLRAVWTDEHLRYVKPQLGPFLVAAGILLVAAAVVTLLHEHRRERAGAGADDGAGAEGPHAHHQPQAGWLLILPIVGLLLVSPPALGSYSAGQTGTILSSEQPSYSGALPDADPARITVLDYAARAVFGQGRSLGGRRVELTGFLVPGPDGEPLLVRMVLSCCAADGRPVKVGMTGEGTPAGQPADTWVRVVGVYSSHTTRDPVNGEPIPYLRVQSWQRIDPPTHQYE